MALRDRERSAASPDRPDGERPRRSPVLRVFYYYFATLLLIQFGVQFLILATLGPADIERWARGEKVVDVALLLVFQALLLPLVLYVTSFFVRVRDGGRLADVGVAWPPGATASFVFGGALAAILLGLWRLVASRFFIFESHEIAAAAQTPWLPLGPLSLALVAVGLLAASFVEELIFHGYIYSTLRERFSWVHAAGLTNLLFLTFHAATPEVGAAALINAFLAGLLLAGLREKTGSLAAGVAFQTLWQLVLGSFYSLPIGGYELPRYRDVRVFGDEQLSGGAYGPEGGWLITAVLILGLALIFAWVERGRAEPADAPALG